MRVPWIARRSNQSILKEIKHEYSLERLMLELKFLYFGHLKAWLSGIWFDLKLVGGFFEGVASVFPFVHAVEMERALFYGDFSLALPHLLVVAIYSISITVISVFCFLKQMKRQ